MMNKYALVLVLSSTLSFQCTNTPFTTADNEPLRPTGTWRLLSSDFDFFQRLAIVNDTTLAISVDGYYLTTHDAEGRRNGPEPPRMNLRLSQDAPHYTLSLKTAPEAPVIQFDVEIKARDTLRLIFDNNAEDVLLTYVRDQDSSWVSESRRIVSAIARFYEVFNNEVNILDASTFQRLPVISDAITHTLMVPMLRIAVQDKSFVLNSPIFITKLKGNYAEAGFTLHAMDRKGKYSEPRQVIVHLRKQGEEWRMPLEDMFGK